MTSVLTAGDHIRNLLGRYCACIDVADFDGVGALFARGELAAGPLDAPAFAVGAAAVAAFYTAGLQVYDGTLRTKHVVANTVLSEEGDGTITATSAYVVLQAVDAAPLRPIVAGRYVDRFTDDADVGWHFVRRHFTMDLEGDLSHHWHGLTG